MFSDDDAGPNRSRLTIGPPGATEPAAVEPSEAERAALEARLRQVAIALRVVIGDDPAEVRAEASQPGCIPTPGVVLPDGKRIGVPAHPADRSPDEILASDVDSLADDLCEHPGYWAQRLPACPRHPDSHALSLRIRAEEVLLSCPVDDVVVRRVSRTPH